MPSQVRILHPAPYIESMIMKTLSTFILGVLSYFFALIATGSVLVMLGLVYVSVVDSQHLRRYALFALAILGAGLISLLLTYVTAGRNQEKFMGRLVDTFIINLLPPR
jgi:uncharacterized membrane protein